MIVPDGIRSCHTMIVYYVWSFGSVAASICLQGIVYKPVKLDPEASEFSYSITFIMLTLVHFAF